MYTYKVKSVYLNAWCLFHQNPISVERLYDQMGLVASAMAFSWSKWNSEVESASVVVQGAEALQDEPLLEVSLPLQAGGLGTPSLLLQAANRGTKPAATAGWVVGGRPATASQLRRGG